MTEIEICYVHKFLKVKLQLKDKRLELYLLGVHSVTYSRASLSKWRVVFFMTRYNADTLYIYRYSGV